MPDTTPATLTGTLRIGQRCVGMGETLTAYLFESDADDALAVALVSSAAGLPLVRGTWVLKLKFVLAVGLPTPFGLDPEPILRGIAANGYFAWDRKRLSPFGTSQ